MNFPTLTACFAAPLLALSGADDWPQFRGTDARGDGGEASAPTSWDVPAGKGVLWKTQVPGLAHSSPIVKAGRIYVTTAVRMTGEAELSSLYGSPGYGAGESVVDEGEHAFQLWCLDEESGVVLWIRTAHVGVPKAKRHPKASHASATPACDDERVVAFFGSEGLYCYDHEGELLWSRDFGVLNVGAPNYPDKDGFQWGFASSPVIHEGRVIVQCDHEGDSFLAALDAGTGETLWRVARDEDSTWCSPTVHDTSATGEPQVIVNGYKDIGGYDLATGARIWSTSDGGDVPVPTPIVEDGLIFLTSAHGRMRPIRAIRVDADGTLTNDPEESAALEWIHPRLGIYMQTPIVVEGLLYCCSDGGVLGCYRTATGEQVYRERLGTGETGFSGSAVAAGGRLYFSGESGEVIVVRPGETFEILARNPMGETLMATPAVGSGRLYFRTRHHLVAVGEG